MGALSSGSGCGPCGGCLDWMYRARTLQQFVALYKKNALVAWRNRRATILRLLAPLLFLLLALLIDKAIQANDSNSEAFKDVKTPGTDLITDIPSCHDDLYIGNRDCIELVFAPNSSSIALDIMSNITSRNSVPITAKGFITSDDAQAFLLANPDYAIGGVYFIFDDEPFQRQLSGFLLQTNTTVKYFKGDYQNPNTFVQLPLQSAVHREIARMFMKQSPSLAAYADKLSWRVGLKTFAHPTIATTSVLGQVLGPFIFAACMFSFVTQISTVVAEKEMGLRQALRTMGMTDAAYWLSWCLWEVTLAFFTAHAICIFGLILQFKLFLNNNYGLLFFLFFLFLLAMSSLALCIVAMLKKTQVAVYIGFCIFIIGWVMQSVVIFGVPYSPDYYHTANSAITIIFSLFPWDLLAKGFQDLGAATVSDDSPGLDWSQQFPSNDNYYCRNIPDETEQAAYVYDPKETYINFKCVMGLQTIYLIYLALWGGYFVLAIYLDNVLKNENGVRRPIFYFVMPSYWVSQSSDAASRLAKVEQHSGEGPPPEGPLDNDVAQEVDKMKSIMNHRTGSGGLAQEVDERNAVEVFGLKKLFKGSMGFCGMSLKCCSMCESCSCERTNDFWAIKDSWFAIAEGQLFCLLGPNGAGKTTTINCLTGVLPVTYGEGLVYGQAISSTGGMDRIRSFMGVCPQFDVLWNELTGEEHLQIYGSVKGINWRTVRGEAAMLLEKVKLTYAAQQRTGAYSGGMKRRLSVAIALLGDPKIVYLDEPTTGMDPISRRYVWDIIQEAKIGRAIVLTTHSMEEADILGDRIAIMARGRLRCIGSSLHLKQKFGSGYQVSVSVMSARSSQQDVEALAGRADRVKQLFKNEMGLVPTDETRAYMHFLVTRDREQQLITFLQRLEQVKAEMGITDVQLSLTSLEEVFLNIARIAEMEAAASAGKSTVAVPLADGTTLEVPMGADLVLNPNNNQTYRVRWGQDEAGRLVVIDCVPAGNDAVAAATVQGNDPVMGMPVAPPVGAPGGTNGTATPAWYQQEQPVSEGLSPRPPMQPAPPRMTYGMQR